MIMTGKTLSISHWYEGIPFRVAVQRPECRAMGRIMPRHLLGRSEACASDLSVIEAARSTNLSLSCRHAKSLLSIIRILAAVVLLTKTGWLFAAEATNSTARSAEVTNSTARSEYKAFQIISDRNIFNPNRSSRSARNGRESAKPV